jgi:hydroxyacylglutathione hydrolase
MTLEDHSGNIIRKARQAAEISVEAAAKAAGVNVQEFSAFEESGRAPNQTNLRPLAELIGLDPARLERIARGWLPSAVELSQWRELRVITTTQEGIAVNCYLIWDEVSREAALFDTGWEAAPILKLLAEEKLHLKHLFLTHTDEDHIAAMAALREHFPKLLLHSNSKNVPPQHRNRANDFIHLGSLRITNRETPGHTEDSVAYIIGTWPDDAPHVIVVGDTIFAGSIGTGKHSIQLLKQKVREQIFTLPNETLLCPGHGPLTTVGIEKQNNPFF